MEKERVVCLNCMDGRVQIPVIHWIQKNHSVINVDMITEPGLDGILANENVSIDEIKRKIDISIEKNDAAMIFVVGHYDCRGNPVSDELHHEQVIAGVKRVKNSYPNFPVVGLWINQDWQVEKVS